jgi:hypothetical protein
MLTGVSSDLESVLICGCVALQPVFLGIGVDWSMR